MKSNVTVMFVKTTYLVYMNLTLYSTTKFISSSIIQVTDQQAIYISLVLGYFVLKETFKIFDTILLVLNLAALIMIILGNKTASDDLPEPLISIWYIWGIMILLPFLTTGCRLALRKKDKFHVYTHLLWLNLTLLFITFIPLIIIKKNSMWEAYKKFGWDSWVIISVSGVSSVFEEIFRAKAFKYQKASLLQVYNPLMIFWTLVFQLTEFHALYSF